VSDRYLYGHEKCTCGHTYANHTNYACYANASCRCRAFVRPIENVSQDSTARVHDPIKAPSYYCRFPDGVEPRHIAGHLTFHLGTALAYIARAGFKGDAAEDIPKAIAHLNFELERIKAK
jgi:hypothetical protein